MGEGEGKKRCRHKLFSGLMSSGETYRRHTDQGDTPGSSGNDPSWTNVSAKLMSWHMKAQSIEKGHAEKINVRVLL